MSRFGLGLLVGCFAFVAAEGAPVISPGGVVNAASRASSDLPNGAIAQGSIVSILGSGLGPATEVEASKFPLPSAQGLAGTFVKISASGQSIDAILLSTSANAVTAIVPSQTPAGSASITVSYQGETSSSQTFQVVTSSFGIYSAHQAGGGPALAQNVVSAKDVRRNSVFAPATPGQSIIIYGTGLGPVTGDETSPLPGDLGSIPAEVLIGGTPAIVEYQGRSGCCAGQDQIIAIVPQTVEGCFVPLAVRIGDVVSNYTSIAVSQDGQVCNGQGAGELTRDELLLWQRNGQLRTGSVLLEKISILSVGGLQGEQQLATATFGSWPVNAADQSFGLMGLVPSMGTCTVPSFASSAPITGLSAGNVLHLANTRSAIDISPNPGGFYAAGLYSAFTGSPVSGVPLLTPGTIKISNGEGGSSVGAFSTEFQYPNEPIWQGRDRTVAVDRHAGIMLTWIGADPGTEVLIYGASNSNNASIGFICRQQAEARQFRVPSEVLLALPATNSTWNNGLLAIVNRQTQRFTAPGLDAGLIEAIDLVARTVSFH